MLIDWFTVGSQFINFFVLVLLMKRFLYRPILQVMADREKRVAATLSDAEDKKAAAQKELTLLQERQKELEGQAAVWLEQAAAEAQQKREALIAAARAEVAALQVQWCESLSQEKELFYHQVMLRVQAEIFAIVRQVLQDLADTDLEQAMARKFIDQLQSVPLDEKTRIAAYVTSTGRPVVIRSGFDLPEPARRDLERAVRSQFCSSANIQFETAPEFTGGIELVTSAHKLSWNMAAYLSALEEGLAKLLEGASEAHAHRQ